MSVPATRSSSGSAVWASTAPRRSRSRRSVPSSISRSDTPGVSSTISAAWSALYFDVMKTLRLAVAQDVRQLAARQPRRRRGVDRPGVVAAPRHLEVPRVVLHAEGHVVARAARPADRSSRDSRLAAASSSANVVTAPVAAITIAGLSGWRVDVRAGVHGAGRYPTVPSRRWIRERSRSPGSSASPSSWPAIPADVPLDRAALAIAAVLRPRPVDGALATLDDIAAGCPSRRSTACATTCSTSSASAETPSTTTTRATRSSTSSWSAAAGCRSCWRR